MLYNSGGVGVLALYALLICLSVLRWYIRRDDQDLAIWGVERFSRIVWGDGRMGDLKREAVWRWLPIDLVAMSCGEKSSKILEHTALASHVFGVLVDGASVVEVTPVVSTIWCLGSIFDLDLALHVARRYVSCVSQAKMRTEGSCEGV
jgi:hypothetical protein